MPACFILNFLIKKKKKKKKQEAVFSRSSAGERQWRDEGDLCAASSSLSIEFLSEGWASAAESNFN